MPFESRLQVDSTLGLQSPGLPCRFWIYQTYKRVSQFLKINFSLSRTYWFFSFSPEKLSSSLKWALSLNLQFSSVAQSCPTLCDLTDCSTPGLPVRHQLPELTQTYVHRVGDAIQPSHPLSFPSPAFNLYQHWGLFQ